MQYFPRYWTNLWGIHRSPVNSPYKGQWRGALMFSLIWAWTNGCVNNQTIEMLGAVSIRKTVLLGMAIPMLKIRRPTGRLIFNMGIPIPGKTVFYIETGPRWFETPPRSLWRHFNDSKLSQLDTYYACLDAAYPGSTNILGGKNVTMRRVLYIDKRRSHLPHANRVGTH